MLELAAAAANPFLAACATTHNMELAGPEKRLTSIYGSAEHNLNLARVRRLSLEIESNRRRCLPELCGCSLSRKNKNDNICYRWDHPFRWSFGKYVFALMLAGFAQTGSVFR